MAARQDTFVRALLCLALASTSACIQPSLLDESRRDVETTPEEVVWRPAQADDFRGLFESTAIEGENAAVLWKVYYHFAADGTFTGAALLLGGENPAFLTLTGTWKLDERGLDLGDGAIARASASDEQLKLENDGGTVVLHRVALQ